MSVKQKYKTPLSILFILLILTTAVYAQENPISSALQRANDFFENDEYKTYSTLIDFFLFFLIALSALLIGVKAIFPDQMRQGNTIAMVIALITTISLVRAGVSIENLLPFIGYIVFFGLVVIIYFFLMATGILKEKKGWAIVVSLVIASIIFILLGWVFDVNAQGLWNRFTETINSFGLLEKIE